MSEGDPRELDLCCLTTTGRVTGAPHRIEIWFGLHEGTVYLLSGGGDRSDWVRNIMASPDVVLEIGGRERNTRARVVSDTEEDAMARQVLLEKYRTRYGGDLGRWGRTAMPVAIAWGEAGPA